MPFPQSANGRESRLDISSFADKKLKDLKNRIDKDTGVFESTSWVENIKGDFVSIQELINQKKALVETTGNKWYAGESDDDSIFVSVFNGDIDVNEMLFYHDGYYWLCTGNRNPDNKKSEADLGNVKLYGWKVPLSKPLELHFGCHFWYKPKFNESPFSDKRLNADVYSNIPWDSKIEFKTFTKFRFSNTEITHDTDNAENKVMDLSYQTNYYMPRMGIEPSLSVKAFHNENTSQEERLELLKSLPFFAQITQEGGIIDVSSCEWTKKDDRTGKNKMTSQEVYDYVKLGFDQATKSCLLLIPQKPIGVVEYHGVLNYGVI